MRAAIRDMTPARWVLWVVLLIGGLIVIFPIYWMLATAVSPDGLAEGGHFYIWPHTVDWGNFTAAWDSQPVASWFANSAIIAIGGVILTTVMSLMAGYAFAKFRFRGRTVLFFAYLITVMIPLQVVMVPEFVIVTKLHLADSYLGVILPGAANAVSVFMARQFMLAIPNELIEAARVDGARDFGVFLRVVLPQCWPLISVLVILNFVGRWNDFLWPLIVLESPNRFTLPIGLNSLNTTFSTPWDLIMAITLLSILPVIAVFAVFQRRFVQGIATSGLK